MKYKLFGLTMLALIACQPTPQTDNSSNAVSKPVVQTPNKVQIAKLGEGVWVHTTLYDIPGTGIVPSNGMAVACLLYTSPSPRDRQKSRMPSSA